MVLELVLLSLRFLLSCELDGVAKGKNVTLLMGCAEVSSKISLSSWELMIEQFIERYLYKR